VQAPPAWATLVGALGSMGIDLRREMAPPALAEAGDTPDSSGGRTMGGTAGARSVRLGWGT
jgi:hypothetical protein